MTKQQQLNQIKGRLDNSTDAIGMPIDEGIKPTVLYLNALGLTTLQSCEGHLNSGRPYPWISIGASDEPDERYIGQTKIFQKVADKYHVPLENVVRMRHEQGFIEASNESSEHPETVEFKAWRAQNEILHGRTTDYLTQFYQYHPQPPTPLTTFKLGGGEFFLQPNISLQETFIWNEMTQDQQNQLRHNLKSWQTEMQTFTEFSKQKFKERP
jgi:hypothetical protein